MDFDLLSIHGFSKIVCSSMFKKLELSYEIRDAEAWIVKYTEDLKNSNQLIKSIIKLQRRY